MDVMRGLGTRASRGRRSCRATVEQMNNIKTTTDDPYGHREFRKQQIEYKKFWTCKICKRDTSAVEYDYLVSHNLHLECALKEELKDMKSDEKKCPYCETGL